MAINYYLLGKRIRESRKKQGLSQEELAYQSDVTAQFISHIENGKKKVSLRVLVSIADSLDVSVDELLTGNQNGDDHEYASAMEKLLMECNRYEKQVLYEQMQSLMHILRDNRNLI